MEISIYIFGNIDNFQEEVLDSLEPAVYTIVKDCDMHLQILDQDIDWNGCEYHLIRVFFQVSHQQKLLLDIVTGEVT